MQNFKGLREFNMKGLKAIILHQKMYPHPFHIHDVHFYLIRALIDYAPDDHFMNGYDRAELEFIAWRNKPEDEKWRDYELFSRNKWQTPDKVNVQY